MRSDEKKKANKGRGGFLAKRKDALVSRHQMRYQHATITAYPSCSARHVMAGFRGIVRRAQSGTGTNAMRDATVPRTLLSACVIIRIECIMNLSCFRGKIIILLCYVLSKRRAVLVF